MKRTVGLLAAVLLVTAFAAMVIRVTNAGEPNTVLEALGDKGAQIIREPERVEIYQIQGLERWTAATQATTLPIAEKIEDFPIVSRGADLNEKMRKRFAEVLLDERTYRAIPSACMFNPHTALRFVRAGESVDVVICLQCDDVEVVVKNDKGGVVSGIIRPFDESHANFGSLIHDAMSAK